MENHDAAVDEQARAALAAEIEMLRRENKALRARVAALEGALLDVREDDARMESGSQERRAQAWGGDADASTQRALRNRKRLLHAVLDNLPSVIFVKDADGRYILVNRRTEAFYGKPRSELLGRWDGDFFPPEAVGAMRAKDQEAVDKGGPIQFEESVALEGEPSHYHTIKFPIFDEDGGLLGVCGIATDITERKREEQERLRLREQVIAAQDEALRELSTPLVPIAEGVVAMPLVGSIDNQRADRIVTTLLDGIVQNQAHSVILDITGVRTVDAHVAGALVAAARSVRLIGARVVVTGIRPEVARTLIELGMNLEGIVTRGNFQSGIAFALKR